MQHPMDTMALRHMRDSEEASSLSSSLASSASVFHLELDQEPFKARPIGQEPVPCKAAHPEGLTGINRHEVSGVVSSSEPAFNPERYLLWHKRALLQRLRVGFGRSHEMQRLYNFWVSFLPENFNNPMYDKFKTYAEEDASAGYTYGLACLFHFYQRYLSAHFEAEVYHDFEALALKYQDYLNYMEGIDCLFAFLTAGGSVTCTTTGSSSSSTPHQQQQQRHSTAPPRVQHGWPLAVDVPVQVEVLVAPSPTAELPAAGVHSSACPTGEEVVGSTAAAGAAATQGQRGNATNINSMSGVSDDTTVSTCGASSSRAVPGSIPSSRSSTPPTLYFPGLPKGSGVSVDPRVVEQFYLWQASQGRRWGSCYGGQHSYNGGGGARASDHEDQGSDIMQIAGSVTGSSEAGDSMPLGDAPCTDPGGGCGSSSGRKGHMQGRRQHGCSWGGVNGPPPFNHGIYGASPPPSFPSLACSLPGPSTLAAAYTLPTLPEPPPLPPHLAAMAAAHHAGSSFKVGSAPGLPPSMLPSGARIKRARNRTSSFKRPSYLPGSSPSVGGVLGSSPPLRPHMSAPYGQQARGGYGPTGRYVKPGGTAGFGKGPGKRGLLNTTTSSSTAAVQLPVTQPCAAAAAHGGDEGGPPLWEAQPCVNVCGPAAELIKALPMRLGELFGD